MDQSSSARVDQLLWGLLQVGPTTHHADAGLSSGQMGHEEVQEISSANGEGVEVVEFGLSSGSKSVCSSRRGMNRKSRMKRELHVRFCEKLEGWLLWFTRPS